MAIIVHILKPQAIVKTGHTTNTRYQLQLTDILVVNTSEEVFQVLPLLPVVQEVLDVSTSIVVVLREAHAVLGLSSLLSTSLLLLPLSSVGTPSIFVTRLRFVEYLNGEFIIVIYKIALRYGLVQTKWKKERHLYTFFYTRPVFQRGPSK